MARSVLARDRGPLVSLHGLEFTCSDFVSYASQGYALLSDLYEEHKAIGVREFLERVGAIRLVEWRQHPSQCRRLAKALLNATLVLQSMVGDERDLQSVIKQKRVSAQWRDEQRASLMEFVKLKVVTRVISAGEAEVEGERLTPDIKDSNGKARCSTVLTQVNDSNGLGFSLDELPM